MKLLFLGALFSVFLCSCMQFPQTQLHADVATATSTKKQNRPVWLISGELHADFVVETSWLVKNGCKLPASVQPYKYVCFGWGDRVAYTERWSITDIPHALLWPSESIVQLVAFNTKVETTFPDHEIARANVPSTKGKALAYFLNESFSYASPSSIEPITLREAKWGHGYFIKCPYSYYFPRMCNQWVGSALEAAGVDTVRVSAMMTSQSLARDVARYAMQN